jgi:hypothetical protein
MTSPVMTWADSDKHKEIKKVSNTNDFCLLRTCKGFLIAFCFGKFLMLNPERRKLYNKDLTQIKGNTAKNSRNTD